MGSACCHTPTSVEDKGDLAVGEDGGQRWTDESLGLPAVLQDSLELESAAAGGGRGAAATSSFAAAEAAHGIDLGNVSLSIVDGEGLAQDASLDRGDARAEEALGAPAKAVEHVVKTAAPDVVKAPVAEAAAAGEAPAPDLREHQQRCRHFERGAGRFGMCINPVVTLVSTVLIWVFVGLCIADPDEMLKAMNIAAFGWIPEVWSWFYIVSQDIWVVALLFVLFVSRYGSLKLGKDDEPPQYSLATWFSMLFSAGVAVGLFYYSVAEPVQNYKGAGGARWTHSAKGYGNDNEDATHALLVCWYHRGLHGWIPYTTMGAVLGIMTHRRGFPLTIRYMFWPLIGERCYGWMGDAVDILSIITTLFGVCTSLGLGAMQVNQGMQRLDHGFYRGVNYNIPADEKYSTPTCGGTGQVCAEGKEPYGIQANVPTQIVIILVITLVATGSVVSGMDRGIVNLSRFTFGLGFALLLLVLFLGETYFCLDVLVQTFGYYLWYILKIAFQTDAFERLGLASMGLGGAPDGKGGSDTWLSNVTLFYWAWWISWAPFCGTFLAKISKGRTLREFILGTLIVPSLYLFLWFGVFGAESIRMQRLADASGVCAAAYTASPSSCVGAGAFGRHSATCGSYSAQYSAAFKEKHSMGWSPPCVLDPHYHGGYGRCAEFAWTRYVEVGNACVESTKWVQVPCGAVPDPTAMAHPPATGPCAGTIKAEHLDVSNAARLYNHFSSTRPPCFVPAQDGIVCLRKQGTTEMLFDLLGSYGPRGFADMLSVVTLVALVLYFVTSSDSGSFVVDMISANGHPNPPIPQRIFWSFTEGATACALLAAGRNLPNSDGSLRALQSTTVIAGLPYTFVLFWCAQSLVLLCREEAGVISKDRKSFGIFIFSLAWPRRLLLAAVAPGIGLSRVIRAVGGWPLHAWKPQIAGGLWGAALQAMYLAALVLVICAASLQQWCIVGLVVYLGFATFLGLLRTTVRNAFRIQHGDLITDLVCGIFAPMFTIAQLEDQVAREGKTGAE